MFKVGRKTDDTKKADDTKKGLLEIPQEHINGIGNEDIRNYICRRVIPSIGHFKTDWQTTRDYERILQYIIIVVGASIPIVNVGGFINSSSVNFLSAFLGGIIVVSTGFLQFEKYHERWLIFKNTKAKLMNEIYSYKYYIGEYADEVKDNVSVEHVIQEILKQFGLDVANTKAAIAKIREAVDNAKIELSNINNKYHNRDRRFIERCETILLSEAVDFVGLFNSLTSKPPSYSTTPRT